MKGIVIKWVAEKKFGFIRPDGTNGDRDHFFHGYELDTETRNQIKLGAEVWFDGYDGPKGLKALEVQVIQRGKNAGNERSAATRKSVAERPL